MINKAELEKDIRDVLRIGKNCNNWLINLKNEVEELMRGDSDAFFIKLDWIKNSLISSTTILYKYKSAGKRNVFTISPPKNHRTSDVDILNLVIESFTKKLELTLIQLEIQLNNIKKNRSHLAIIYLQQGIPDEFSYLLEKIEEIRLLAKKI